MGVTIHLAIIIFLSFHVVTIAIGLLCLVLLTVVFAFICYVINRFGGNCGSRRNHLPNLTTVENCYSVQQPSPGMYMHTSTNMMAPPSLYDSSPGNNGGNVTLEMDVRDPGGSGEDCGGSDGGSYGGGSCGGGD